MPLTSSEENQLSEQVAKNEALQEMLEDDVETDSPTQTEFSNAATNLPPYKQSYLDLRVAYKKYKARYVPSIVSEADFNGAESTYTYNDPWLDRTKKDFFRFNKVVLKFLNSGQSNENGEEEKFSLSTKAEVERLVSKIKLESGQATASIDDTYKRLQSYPQISPNQAHVYSNLQCQLVSVVDEKIPALFNSLAAVAGSSDQTVVNQIRQEFAAFESQEKTRLYQMIQLIAEKTSSDMPVATGRTSAPKSEAVHLKKVDPPKFSGEEIDFPEFHRKWLAVVVPARLPDEAEVDRLRDALPKDAREMLTGINKTARAWEILKKRFGDEDLIATKLKNELKGLNITVKEEHERIIALVIKIRSLVSRLESLKASEALKYDGEFVSAVYFQLPDRQRNEWLKFDKSIHSHKWSALLAFLEEVYDRAVQEKLLLASYTPPAREASGKKATAAVFATKLGVTFTAKALPSGGRTRQDHPSDSAGIKNLKPCLACDDGATNKSSIMHRLFECEVWKGLTLTQKKEKAQCVKHPWTRDHTTLTCKFKSSCWKCKSEDHHQLFCPSVVKASTKVGQVASDDDGSYDELSPVLLPALYVRGVKGTYGTLMDNCSTDNYVVNDTAIRQNLKSLREVKLEVEGICGEVTQVDSTVYLVAVKAENGRVHNLECYGVDLIAKNPALPDAEAYGALCKMFDVAKGKVRRPEKIDLLISMRESHLMPDKVKTLGKLTLHSSPFGATFGGSDPSLKFGNHQKTFKSTAQVIPTVSAVTLRASMVLDRSAIHEVLVGVRHSGEEFCTENINEEENRRSCPVATGIKRSESCPVATPTHDEGTDISDQNEVNGKFESSKVPAKQVSMMEDGSMNSSKCFLGMKDPSKDLLEYFKEESIGVECSPKCGNCICGKCALGSKKMSLANERKYADFQSRMKYDEEGTVEDPGPYFTVEEFPFIIPKEDLVDNYPAVLRVINSTAKKLEKNELWRKVYETQLRDPAWILYDEEFWSVTVRAPLSVEQQETVRKFEKAIKPVKPAVPKSVAQHSVVFLSGSKQISKVRTEKVMKIPASMNVSAYNLDSAIARCGSLRMLIRATSYFLRMVGRRHLLSLNKGEIESSAYSFRIGEISQSEYDDAWNFLISWEQSQRLDRRKCQGLCPVEVKVQLQNYPITVSQITISGRVKNIPEGFSANSRIPIIPRGSFGKLIARHYHNKYHFDVDATVAHVRADVWVVEARKMVTSIDKNCVVCKIKRKATAKQVMGDLPSYRYDAMSPPWTVVLIDLWGPMMIRDDCIKKGPRIFKKVWGVLFS